MITRERGIIEVKTVILIALLALARKVVVVDPYEVAPGSVAALAAITVSLGLTYWLMRERDDRDSEHGRVAKPPVAAAKTP